MTEAKDDKLGTGELGIIFCLSPKLGKFKQVARKRGGNDVCAATAMAVLAPHQRRSVSAKDFSPQTRSQSGQRCFALAGGHNQDLDPNGPLSFNTCPRVCDRKSPNRRKSVTESQMITENSSQKVRQSQ